MGRPSLGRPRGVSYQAKLSTWDTDLFNYVVGTLNLGVLPRISRILEDNEKFDVIFVKIPGWVDVPYGVEALDYRYDMELADSSREAEKYPVKVIESAFTDHLELAGRAFIDSRFNFDRRLKSRAYEVYSRWLANAHTIYTLTSHPKDAFVAVEDDDGARRIALIAVSEKLRSTRLGQTLVRGMFGVEKKKTWRVRVSAKNYRAIRFYETLGFRMKDVSTAFHVWTHEESS
jgi:ribosomal protein S18 acetylase RimI-like enzyme